MINQIKNYFSSRGLVLGHINYCRLLMPNPFLHKKFDFKQFSLAWVQFQCQTVPFQTLEFSRSTQGPIYGSKNYQVLPLQTRVNLGVMTMKGYSTFSKAPALLEPNHQIVSCHTRKHMGGGVLTPLQRSSQCIL